MLHIAFLLIFFILNCEAIHSPLSPITSTLHNPQLPKPLQHLLIHPTQPLLLKPLLTTYLLDNLLQMLSDKHDEVDLMHRVGVDEFALADIFWSFGFGWVVRLWGPV
jgi:hypothetical protein